MIIQNALGSAAASIGSVSTLELDYVPTSGQTIMIPATDALLINVLLWPDTPVDNFQLILPEGYVSARRVFIYADQSVQMTVTATDGTVANGVITMNQNDLAVFNTVSTSKKLWARVATT